MSYDFSVLVFAFHQIEDMTNNLVLLKIRFSVTDKIPASRNSVRKLDPYLSTRRIVQLFFSCHSMLYGRPADADCVIH